ncbi:hypothetical protein JTB14_025317 [Gonioctena quinquepunctata]|nr:hypothetical protein JTB14_025317 [Gonioctena quinquepunctata]
MFSGKPNALSAVFLSGDFNKSDWFVDSGANVHLTANEVWLQNECTSKVQELWWPISQWYEQKAVVRYKLKRSWMTAVSQLLLKMYLLYVPELTTNLLSMSQLIKNGGG